MDNTLPPVADTDDEDVDDRDLGRVSIRDMRKYGLHFVGGGHIPGVPSQDMTGPEAAVAIPDRPTLLSVLRVGYHVLNAPPDPPPSDPPPPKASKALPPAPPVTEEAPHGR